MRKVRLDFGLLLLSLLALIGVIILIMLGNWQMARKQWKSELIKTVEMRLDQAPIAFEKVFERFNVQDMAYVPVWLEGRFLHKEERHYFLPLGAQVGWHILTPFELKNGGVVFVDRGFVPQDLKEQKKRLKGLPEGDLKIEGLVRLFEAKGWFTPDNQALTNEWYWRDEAGLYDSLPAYQGKRYQVMVDARKSAQFGTWPKAGVTRVKFQDKHLGYALTWYGLALALIGVFCAFVVTRLKR